MNPIGNPSCATGSARPARSSRAGHGRALWLTVPVIRPDVFRDQPTLPGTAVGLEPLGSQHFDVLWETHAEPEVRMLTGKAWSATC
jgi:hypothetical protein